MKRFRNFLLLMRFWGVLTTSKKIITDPESNRSKIMVQDLTSEEMDGVATMEIVGRILDMDRKELKKDLEHLRERFVK